MTVIEGWERPPAPAGFSASDISLTGFELTRRQPRTVLVWAALLLVVNLVLNAVLVSSAGPALMALRGVARPDAAQSLQLLQSMAPFYLLSLPVLLALMSVLLAAVNRAVLRPGEGGLGRLRLGRDELRQLGLLLLLNLILVGVELVAAVLLGVLVGIAAAAGNSTAGGIVTGLGVLAILGLIVWLEVRLSLASPLAFDTGRIRLRQAFALTKGRFWGLFGAYLLAVIFVLLILAVFLVVMAVLALLLGGGLAGVGRVFSPDMSSVGGYFTPLVLLQLLLSAGASAVQTAVLFGAPAAAYAQFRGAAAGGIVPAP